MPGTERVEVTTNQIFASQSGEEPGGIIVWRCGAASVAPRWAPLLLFICKAALLNYSFGTATLIRGHIYRELEV